MASKVYFTRDLTAAGALKALDALHVSLPGKVAVKLHSGEVGNQNFLRPDFCKPIVERVNGTVVECNTAYEGGRNTTEKHWKTMELHGWSRYFTVASWTRRGPIRSWTSPTASRSRKTMWAGTSTTTTPFWS